MKLNVSVSGVHQFLDFSTGAQTNTLVLNIAGEEVHVECSEETLTRWIRRSRGIETDTPLPQPRPAPVRAPAPEAPPSPGPLTADDLDLEPDDLSDPFQPDVHAPPMFDELPETVAANIQAYTPTSAESRLQQLHAAANVSVSAFATHQATLAAGAAKPAPRAAIPSPIDQPRQIVQPPPPQPAGQDDLFGSQG